MDRVLVRIMAPGPTQSRYERHTAERRPGGPAHEGPGVRSGAFAAVGTPTSPGAAAPPQYRPPVPLPLQVLSHPADVGPALRADLLDCWIEVSDAGGAVGFPSPPVDPAEVERALGAVLASLGTTTYLVTTSDDEGLAGWVGLVLNDGTLTGHWGTVVRLQSRPRCRGRGVGTALLQRTCALAGELGLQQLHLMVRAGTGTDRFYLRQGWREVGRYPRALQVEPGRYRDQILMLLDLAPNERQ